MTDTALITKVESFVRKAFEGKKGRILIAHDFAHVNRVRNWALLITKEEQYTRSDLVELAALLHDIDLPLLAENRDRGKHGELSAEIAAEYLSANSTLPDEDIDTVTTAIRYHSRWPSIADRFVVENPEKGIPVTILRDADSLDAVGAAGIMRAFTSHHHLPEYEEGFIKGRYWGLNTEGFMAAHGLTMQDKIPGPETIIDQINQQIRYQENFRTETAKRLAEPMIRYMKDFLLQLEEEVCNCRK